MEKLGVKECSYEPIRSKRLCPVCGGRYWMVADIWNRSFDFDPYRSPGYCVLDFKRAHLIDLDGSNPVLTEEAQLMYVCCDCSVVLSSGQ